MAQAAGLQKEQALRNAGFSDEDVGAWKGRAVDALAQGGYSAREIDEYFGVKEPDTKPMVDYVKTNMAAVAEKEKNSTAPKEAKTWLEALEAGWDVSVTGLATQGGNPDVVLPENGGRIMNVAATIAQIAGDLPAIAVGAAAGGGPASPITSAAAGFAAPEAMRQMLMGYYDRGEIKTAADFWDRLSGATWSTIKSAAIGAATGGAGKLVQGVARASGRGAARFVQPVAKTTAEIGTMVTVGAGLEGELPDADDFINAGLAIGTFHGVSRIPSKIRRVYGKLGTKPSEVAEMAATDFTLKQNILSSNPDVPIETGAFKQAELPKSEVTKPFEGFESAVGSEIPVPKAEVKLEGPSTWGKYYQGYVDSLDPIKRVVDAAAGKVKLEAGENPEMLMRTYADVQGKTQRAISFNTIDFKTGKPNGEGLEPILRRVPNKEGAEVTEFESKILSRLNESELRDTSWKKLTSFMVSQRALELANRGIETGIDLDAAQKVVSAGKAEYSSIAKEIREFTRRMKDYAEDAGLLDKNGSALMEMMNENHIPFYRLLEKQPQPGVGGIPFKRIKGSDLPILDPIQSIYKNTDAIFKAAERNRAMTALVEFNNKLPENGRFLNKADLKSQSTRVTDKEIQKFIQEQGIEGEVEGFLDVWRKRQDKLDDNQFIWYNKGKRMVLEAKPEIAEAINTLNGHAGMTGMFFKISNGVAQALRAGVTLSPDFIARNFIRDQMTAGVQSRFGQIPFIESLRSIGHVWNKDKVWQEFISSGGAMGGFGEVARHIENNTWGQLQSTGHLSRMWNVVKSPFQMMAAVSELVENAPRVAEFKRAGGVGGTFSEKVTAATAARDVTVDFARRGSDAKIKFLTSITPFLNVGIQGPDKMLRSYKENPSKFIARSSTLTALSLMLYAANRGDSRVQEAPNWEKMIFWHVGIDQWQQATYQEAAARPEDLRRQLPDGSWEINNGPLLRIPKPFLVGFLFATLPERVLDKYFDENPAAFDGFAQSIWDALLPNFIPPVVTGPLEHFANRSFFTGNDLVPHHLEKVLPEYQYMEYTSETARAIGKVIGYIPGLRDIGPKDAKLNSPLVIENYIRTWTGTGGKYITELIDAGLRAVDKDAVEKPESALADVPFVRAFVSRHPHSRVQSIVDFRERYEKASKLQASLKVLVKNGDLAAAEKLYGSDPAAFLKLDGIYKSIGEINKSIRGVNASPDMSPEDKRQLIDTMYYQMIQITREGNALLREHEKAVENRSSQEEN